MNRKLALLLLICLVCSPWPAAQSATRGDSKSCRRFTQAFYNWYVAKVFEPFDSKDEGADRLLEALDYKGHPFSRELAEGIRKVKAEEAKSNEAILDFDPILNSQDPAEHYRVRRVSERNGRYFAEIYGVWNRPVSDIGKGPQVVAELTYRQGRWIFLNFHYPDVHDRTWGDLSNILKSALR